jgi:hypothetical protein
MTLVLLLTLFTMMSVTAFAQSQKRQGLRAHTISSLQSVLSGRADLQWNPQSKVLTATLHLSGLQPGSNHAAHIHAGTCSSRETILYPFKNVIANADGNAVSTTTFTNVTGGIPATGWNITVHVGPTAQTGTLLCGNVVNPMRATSLAIPLH